jgi:hypothetical protein
MVIAISPKWSGGPGSGGTALGVVDVFEFGVDHAIIGRGTGIRPAARRIASPIRIAAWASASLCCRIRAGSSPVIAFRSVVIAVSISRRSASPTWLPSSCRFLSVL